MKTRKQINPNYSKLVSCISDKGFRGVVLEGGSRSGKTWAAIDFILMLCATSSGLTINIIKETFAGFKTTLYADFAKRLDQIYEPNQFSKVQNISNFTLWGNKLAFLGADQAAKFHGASCDYFWINEALDVDQSIFDQLEMRCRRAWILDFNPKLTTHWIFDKIEKRPDVAWLQTTMMDNPFIGIWEKRKIQSYEPTPENIANGTADDYMWAVYGLGLRCAQTGLIFRNINWIDHFPDEVERIWFGMDFGYTVDPTALVKIAVNGNDLYLQECLYTPVENADVLHLIIAPIVGSSVVWCDSADPQMREDLQRKGLRAFPAKKFPGSIQHGIDVLKRYRLNIVNSHNFKKEAANYAWRSIQGIQINEPIDQFNHLWDASRYGCQMELSKRVGFTV